MTATPIAPTPYYIPQYLVDRRWEAVCWSVEFVEESRDSRQLAIML